MTEDEFAAGLDRWGADLRRWPDAGRAVEAEMLLGAARPSLRRAWEQAAGLDAILIAAVPPPPAQRLARLERVVLAHLDELAAIPADWFAWLTMPRGAVFVGLFLLGCLANLLVRQTVMAPFDLLFAANLLFPLGG